MEGIALHETVAAVMAAGLATKDTPFATCPRTPTPAEIERIEEAGLQLPQVDVPLVHRFAPGVYMREVTMPAGSMVIGHQHKTEHFNVILTGKAWVWMDGSLHTVEAPAIIVSKPGVRKVLLIHEEMRWATIHPTEETDQDKLDELLIIKSPTFLAHQHIEGVAELKRLEGAQWPG